nr:hypothetical protein [Mucilaginibacter sp. X4EP1]
MDISLVIEQVYYAPFLAQGTVIQNQKHKASISTV